MTNTAGMTYANSGAMVAQLSITLISGVFGHNRVVSATLPGSPS